MSICFKCNLTLRNVYIGCFNIWRTNQGFVWVIYKLQIPLSFRSLTADRRSFLAAGSFQYQAKQRLCWCDKSLERIANDPINQPVLHRLLGAHEEITIGIRNDLFQRLASVIGKVTVQVGLVVENLVSLFTHTKARGLDLARKSSNFCRTQAGSNNGRMGNKEDIEDTHQSIPNA
jgi:hypothetical protein